MLALQREAFWAKERLLGDLRQSVPQNGRVHLHCVDLSGTGDSQPDSPESIRANHSQLKHLFYSASGRFARITRISDSRESPDSRDSRESIRANHATKV